MQILRLNNINLHAPYKVMQDPEKEFNFYFVSDAGTRFDIGLITGRALQTLPATHEVK